MENQSNELKTLIKVMEDMVGEENSSDIGKSIASIVEMSEENFTILAPGIMDSFVRSLNNNNDKIMLVQAMNLNKLTIEDVKESFEEVNKVIDNTEELTIQKKDFLKQMFGAIMNSLMDAEGIAKRFIQIPYEKCNENAKMPEYAHLSDSGMDLFALEDITINPGETKLIPTGIKVALPPGYELQVRPKSGRALKTKLRVANTPGTIDAGYRDEIKVIIENVEAPIKDITYDFDEHGRPIITSIEHGKNFTIGKGEKFAQLVLMEVPKANFILVDNVLEMGENRNGGFGSTGLK